MSRADSAPHVHRTEIAMPHLTSSPIRQPGRTLEGIAWFWLWSGTLALWLVPAARVYSPTIGWIWYWLVGAPLLVLAAVHAWRAISALDARIAQPTAPRLA
jgi:hypothetical protein